MVPVILLFGGLGFVFSIILAVIYGEVVHEDTFSMKYKRVLENMPGVDCGECGFSKCESYAKALVDGKSVIGLCPIGGKELIGKISEILNIEPVEVESRVAIIRCRGDTTHTHERFNYVGIKNCFASSLIAKGPKSCTYGCLGFGDCVSVCKFGAINIGENALPIIDDKRCNGCGRCVKACPRRLLELVPKVQKIYVACVSPEVNELPNSNCRVRCTACGLCTTHCPYNAIKIEKHRARIVFEECQNCAICVYKCPTGTFVDKLKSRPKAMIGMSCTGCEKCKDVCPMDAIIGKAREQHKVGFDKCIGCGLCYKMCEDNAITMAFSLGYVEV